MTVGRQSGGTVTSADGRISCGTSTALCGPVSYGWSEVVLLTATPDAGNMLGTWAGDCSGREACTLSTTPYGADKYVVAVFGPAARTQHTNFSSPAVHGPAFREWLASGNGPDTFECRYCHGSTYNGLGTAPSCNACHARNGFPQATDCNDCHLSPPPPPHPAVADITGCATCHATTVDASGNIIAGGTHMNGRLDGGGHEAGFADPAEHGPAFVLSLSPAGSTCAACHGETYEAPIVDGESCTTCHASAGFPNFLANCTFCHGAPPPPAPAGLTADPHPAVSSDVTTCFGCHPTSIDPSGSSIAGGTHMNGSFEGGHVAGFVAPAVHGREFFQWVSGSGGAACTDCHGSSYEATIANGLSCNTCHSGAGWTSWQTNCSFCHGVKDATTQAGYDVAVHPTFSAPPDAISQRLDGAPAPERTGAHAAHLASTTDAVLCSACHDVPADLTHISGREARAAVVLDGAPVPAVPNQGYRGDGTCMTYCHDRTGTNSSPAWTGTLECDGCHAVPPATTAHLGLTGAEASLGSECSGCHETIRTDGSIDPVWHINGSVESPAGHAAGFADRQVHGPQALDAFAGIGTACNSCHVGYANCDSCHASATNPAPAVAWTPTSWDENCTFCHGTRTPGYTAANLTLASPPDSINQRLTGSITSQARRIGKHREHLVFDTNEPLYPAFPCATCHAVPTTLSHISPSTPERRATVAINLQGAFPALTASEVAALPNGASYDPVSGRCSVYCHGSTAWGAAATNPTSNPLWSTAGGTIGVASCNACHGSPPPTGTRMPPDDYCNPVDPATDCAIHEWHGNVLGAFGLNGCDACHSSFVHLNGVSDVVFAPRTLPSLNPVSGTWDRANGSCTVNCHSEVIDPGLTPPGNPQFWR